MVINNETGVLSKHLHTSTYGSRMYLLKTVYVVCKWIIREKNRTTQVWKNIKPTRFSGGGKTNRYLPWTCLFFFRVFGMDRVQCAIHTECQGNYGFWTELWRWRRDLRTKLWSGNFSDCLLCDLRIVSSVRYEFHLLKLLLTIITWTRIRVGYPIRALETKAIRNLTMFLYFETRFDDCPLCYTTKIVNIIVLAAAVIISVLVHTISSNTQHFLPSYFVASISTHKYICVYLIHFTYFMQFS